MYVFMYVLYFDWINNCTWLNQIVDSQVSGFLLSFQMDFKGKGVKSIVHRQLNEPTDGFYIIIDEKKKKKTGRDCGKG